MACAARGQACEARPPTRHLPPQPFVQASVLTSLMGRNGLDQWPRDGPGPDLAHRGGSGVSPTGARPGRGNSRSRRPKVARRAER